MQVWKSCCVIITLKKETGHWHLRVYHWNEHIGLLGKDMFAKWSSVKSQNKMICLSEQYSSVICVYWHDSAWFEAPIIYLAAIDFLLCAFVCYLQSHIASNGVEKTWATNFSIRYGKRVTSTFRMPETLCIKHPTTPVIIISITKSKNNIIMYSWYTVSIIGNYFTIWKANTVVCYIANYTVLLQNKLKQPIKRHLCCYKT